MIKVQNTANKYVISVQEPFGTYTNKEGEELEGFTLRKLKSFINDVQNGTIKIELFSPGGDVFEAFALYDYVKSLNQRVECNIVGSSASAATIFASACDYTSITENSRYLVHFCQTKIEGSKDKFKEAYDMMAQIDDQIINAYIKRTGQSRETLAQLMTEERWLTAQEALDWGFVDEIIKNKVNNMKKFENLTPDEQAEMDQLLADKAALQERVTQLEAELSEIRDAEAAAEEQEITEAVDEVVKEDEEMKASLVAYGKLHKIEALKKVLNAMKVATKEPELDKVVNPTNTVPADKKAAWDEFKAGKITAQKYMELIKNLK